MGRLLAIGGAGRVGNLLHRPKAEAEGREEAMSTLVIYGPVIAFIVIGIMLVGWMKARQQKARSDDGLRRRD
jgi:hypothetical protein